MESAERDAPSHAYNGPPPPVPPPHNRRQNPPHLQAHHPLGIVFKRLTELFKIMVKSSLRC